MRWIVSQLFDGHEMSQHELAAIRERLEALSAECPTHTFAATRAANVSLGGHPVSLVYGSVIVPTARGANTTKSILLSRKEMTLIGCAAFPTCLNSPLLALPRQCFG